MTCRMNMLINNNVNIDINIKIGINTNPATSITNALAASDGIICGPRRVDPMTHDRPLPTPVARVVAIHEDQTTARPSQCMY